MAAPPLFLRAATIAMPIGGGKPASQPDFFRPALARILFRVIMSLRGMDSISHDLHGGSGMSISTLSFVDSLLARGRYLQHLGRTYDALRIMTRLAGFRELPPAVAEEVQFRLGELQLRRKKKA